MSHQNADVQVSAESTMTPMNDTFSALMAREILENSRAGSVTLRVKYAWSRSAIGPGSNAAHHALRALLWELSEASEAESGERRQDELYERPDRDEDQLSDADHGAALECERRGRDAERKSTSALSRRASMVRGSSESRAMRAVDASTRARTGQRREEKET